MTERSTSAAHAMTEFVAEEDLETFEGWLKYQIGDAIVLSAEELNVWRSAFADGRARVAATPAFGTMKLAPLRAGEYRYAVAVEEAGVLWLVLWIRRNPKGEISVMTPRDADWDPHTSYHLDGSFHAKSYGMKFPFNQKKQPLSGAFRGHEYLGRHAGYGPKSVGAVAAAQAYSGLLVLPPGLLGPRNGYIDVELVEPGVDIPEDDTYPVFAQAVYRDFSPWLVVTVRR